MEYMINFDSNVIDFKTQCKSNGGSFIFDVPKILTCNESDGNGYIGNPIMMTVDSDSMDSSTQHPNDSEMRK
jgi:hypothetical protein